jgi:hypothetical protein
VRREWFWWDGFVDEAGIVHVSVQVMGWPAPLGALDWLLRAGGAQNVAHNWYAAGEGAGGAEKAIVIGEDMEGRVIPTANRLGADYYNSPEAPPEEWMENNRQWINDRMDEGCTIYDCGAAPGRANYPDPTSPYYKMELGEIGNRGYPTTPVDVR